ncbi:GNAT family N-acetyltransferase [Streptomyces sp. NPDC047072]|uniref:GNAT family N-acetyltransferase n=1 Tax=Streptomyces sp. NPDC047072 TaxID=3154809 RepID=UPI0033C063E9
MAPVDITLARVWPSQLRTDRLLLRPVVPDDAHLIRTLLTDKRVRAYLGGPPSSERVAARQCAYPQTPGAWTVVRVADDEAVGLVTLSADHRCTGRAEISYQLLPDVWGQGLGREAVSAVTRLWTTVAPDGGPVVAVTQQANVASRRLLESIGMELVEEIEEHGERQCIYTPSIDEDDAELRWARLIFARLDEVERRRGDEARATPEGQQLPDDRSVLAPEELAKLCPVRHGGYGRICARTAGHGPDLHLGRAPDGGWIAWLTCSAE